MVIFLAIPVTLISGFIAPDEAARDQVLAVGVTLLAMAALFQVVDAAQVMALGLLRGVQDTAVPFGIAVFSYWIVGLPLSYLFGIVLGGGAVGIWAGLVGGLGIASVLLMWRFWGRSVRIGYSAA